MLSLLYFADQESACDSLTKQLESAEQERVKLQWRKYILYEYIAAAKAMRPPDVERRDGSRRLPELTMSVPPWLATMLIFLVMVTYIPEISLFLPRLLGMLH